MPTFINNISRIKTIHFIGIGGSGMSGIAEVLLNQGYNVSGSDNNESTTTARLKRLGANVFYGHAADQLNGADAVVVSTAILADNPELIAAKKARLPILPRAQMLAELMRFNYGIAVAGTHGKTTTTSLIASILGEGGLDPTFVIGGLLNSVGTYARLGASRYFVAEADESDASFLRLHPLISVVTNIDADHMQTYDHDFSKLEKAFRDFLHNLPFYGVAVLCIDNPTVKSLLPKIARPIVTYGFDVDADFFAKKVRHIGLTSEYEVHVKKTKSVLKVKLNLPGRHNVLNSLAAIAVAMECNVATEAILKALANFKGVGRRLQFHGELPILKNGGQVAVIDDYGHHPVEIKASCDALRTAWPERRLILAFQPHRYSRTQDLFDEFAIALSAVDMLVLVEIYAAGEKPISGVTSTALAQNIRKRGKVDPIYVKSAAELPESLLNILKPNDVLLLQGAGNIGNVVATIRNFKK